MINAEAHPLALFVAMFKWLGKGCLEWEGETVWAELEQLGVTRLPQIVKDKFMAVRGAHRINDFYSNYRSFEILTNALNGIIPDFTYVQPVTIPQILNAVEIFKQIRNDDEYNPEVKAYIKTIANQEGYAVLPEELHFVEEPDWQEFYNDIKERTKVLLRDESKFNISSAVDGQAIKFAECYSYLQAQEETFSNNINQYFKF
ncbi:MAG: hypothetical protein PHY54_19285 [Methylococcales bacterium]|nr:hypothetical protein [Methylococcales bacterium]